LTKETPINFGIYGKDFVSSNIKLKEHLYKKKADQPHFPFRHVAFLKKE